MSQHHYRRDCQRDVVVLRDGRWVRSNYHGEFTMISPRRYSLPPGLFHNRREQQDALWGLAGVAVGLLIGLVVAGVFPRT